MPTTTLKILAGAAAALALLPATAPAQPSFDAWLPASTTPSLVSQVSPAVAIDPAAKPDDHAVAESPASDADGAAAARRIEKEGSALGSYFDEAAGEMVVVVGPEGGLGEDEARKLAGGPARLVRLEISKETVAAIRERIAAREFSPEAEQYGYASWLDLRTGQVVLKTDAPEAVTDPLMEEFPGAIERRDGRLRELFHRRDDSAPFWGGGSLVSGGTCTAGFAVRDPSGRRFLTTASHCAGVGATVRTPLGRVVGNVTVQGSLRSPWFWDNRDVELIGGQSYSGRVYVGGTTSTASKAVVGASDPVPGVSSYCSSGQTSGEQCGITVQSTEAIACVRTAGCFWPVIAYTGGPGQGGDSGGPVYIPGSPGQVFARGTLFAGDGTTTYAEKWTKISSAFGVSIATP
jgi:hypothetical protein